jgi:phosphopantetheinyl transferase
MLSLTDTISTNLGEIFISSAEQLGLHRSRFETKTLYQRACSQALIKKSIGDYRLIQDSNGAPLLEHNPEQHISISHSQNLFVLYVSSVCHVGVDIELYNRNLDSGKTYFLNSFELSVSWSEKDLYLIWCVKEVYYKMNRGKVKMVYDKISIHHISRNTVIAFCEDTIIKFYYKWIGDACIVYS